MGAGQSKGSSLKRPETEVSSDGSEQTFYAQRQQAPSSNESGGANVSFDQNLIHHLSSNSATSTDFNPSSSSSSSTSSSSNTIPLSRQQHLDQHIQQRIQSELKKLHSQEQSIREQIQKALEKENLEKELNHSKNSKDGNKNLHSVSLLKDLENLEKQSSILKGGKFIQDQEWKVLEKERESLVQCFRNNKETPLECASQVEKFKQAVQGIETVRLIFDHNAMLSLKRMRIFLRV